MLSNYGYNKGEMKMPIRKLRRHNEAWTPADLKMMRSIARSKLPARTAAQFLGRSTGSVKYKAMVEGIRFQAINQPVGVQKRLARRNRRRR